MTRTLYLVLLCSLACDFIYSYYQVPSPGLSACSLKFRTNINQNRHSHRPLSFSQLFSNGQIPLPSCASTRRNVDLELNIIEAVNANDNKQDNNNSFSQFNQPINFLLRAGFIGISTGLGVVLLKTLIFNTQGLLYENLADALPKPVFYWPIALYPIIGASFVSSLAYFYGPKIWNGLDYIAKSIDSDNTKSMTDNMSNNLFLDLNIDANINNSTEDAIFASGKTESSMITDNIVNSNKKSFNPKQFIYTNFLSAQSTLLNNLIHMNSSSSNIYNSSSVDNNLNSLGINDISSNMKLRRDSGSFNNSISKSVSFKSSDNSNIILSDDNAAGTIVSESSLSSSLSSAQSNLMSEFNALKNRFQSSNNIQYSSGSKTDQNGDANSPLSTSISSTAAVSNANKNLFFNQIKLFLNQLIISNNTITTTTALEPTVAPPATPPTVFDPLALTLRLAGAATTLGSGCSLGPEGPSVEIGAGFSRYFSELTSTTSQLQQQRQQPQNVWWNNPFNISNNNNNNQMMMSAREKHHLFLAGTAAGVSAGFGAPIAGVFFALECGNRCLARNTVKLEEDVSDAPRADIAAIVLAATLSNIVVQLLLQNRETLFIQGNSYAMVSPFFELPVYFGLSLISGSIAVIFDLLKVYFKAFYKQLNIAKYYRPLLGGLVCGVVAVFFPQTLFNGYATLGDLLSSKYQSTSYSDFILLMELLIIKLLLSSFSLVSGLIGGVFAPSLFFGAIAGTAYHFIVAHLAVGLQLFIAHHSSDVVGVTTYINQLIHSLSPILPVDAAASHTVSSVISASGSSGDFINNELFLSRFITFFTISNAQAYATVGAAATLGSLFKAPLTSSMLMFELTQNHDIVLPVLFSTGLGGFFASIISNNNNNNRPTSNTVSSSDGNRKK